MVHPSCFSPHTLSKVSTPSQMPEKNPSERGPSSDGNTRRLLSHQTPTRMSPRFRPQINNDSKITSTSTYRKKPNKPSAEKPHLKSPPISPASQGAASTKKTQQEYPEKSQKNPLKLVENHKDLSEEFQTKSPRSIGPRRSPRLAFSIEFTTVERTHLKSSPISPFSEETASTKKTHQGSLDKSKDKPFSLVKNHQEVSEKCQIKSPSIGPRRSPRLASNPTEVPTLEKTHLRSPPISLVSEETASTKKTHQGYLEKSKNKPLSSIKIPQELSVESQIKSPLTAPRRSPRFVSNSTEELATLNVTEKAGSVKERRKSIRLMGSAKVSEKEEVGIDGLEVVKGNTERGKRKENNSVVLTPREGGEMKKRRINRDTVREIGNGGKQIEQCCNFQGWTKDQEVELRRAYLVAKPSPHFWKKVSKMVPGKSAQECFDRVHADLATPPQPQPRSRTNKTDVSPIGYFTLSGSKSMELNEPNVKRLRRSKQKSLVTQKTVRHLLRKHHLVDQSKEADLFSILETSPTAFDSPAIKMPATPDCIVNPPGFLQKCNGMSSSAHKKMLSRFKAPIQANHVSPEVLKRIKNVALHEKYIDQLHCREARRRTLAKSSFAPANNNSNGQLKTGVLKAARTALISEARDFIFQFQHMQANPLGNHEGFDLDDENDDDGDVDFDGDDDDE